MRILVYVFLFTWSSIIVAQNKQILYGVSQVPQNLLVNPGAIVGQDKHFGIPFLSQLHANGGSSGVSAYDIFGDTGENINTKIGAKIRELNNTDFFTATEQLELIYFGWRARNDIYFSGGIYQELDFVAYFPKDLATLAWEGNRDYIGYHFNLGEVNVTADLLTAYHFGLNKQINKDWIVGARAKIYSGMLNFRSTNNAGTFVTNIGDGSANIYEHSIVGGNVSVQSSGYASLRDLDGSSQVVNTLLGRAFFGGSIGVGVDLGATYLLNKKWTVSASVIDLGTMFQTKDVENYEIKGDYTLDGIELLFPDLEDGEQTIPYYDNLIDEIQDTFPVDTLNTSYTHLRPVKLNADVRYGFGGKGGKNECDCRNRGGVQEYDQYLGAHVFSVFRPKGPQFAGTLFYSRKLSQSILAKVTYTADSYSFSNIGLGFVADMGIVNFYIAADNLLWYQNLAKAKSVSLQLGFNIKIDKQ